MVTFNCFDRREKDLPEANRLIEEALLLSRQAYSSKSNPKQYQSSQIASLRSTLQALALAEAEVKDRLINLIPDPDFSSRSGYLRSLSEILGPRPVDRTWKDEWAHMLFEMKKSIGELELSIDLSKDWKTDTNTWAASQDFVWGVEKVPKGTIIDIDWIKKYESPEVLSDPKNDQWITETIRRSVEQGWSTKDATMMTLLTIPRKQISRALQAGSDVYAASTYALCDIFSRKCHQQEESGLKPPILYRPLYGDNGSLVDVDPLWNDIESSDSTGFCGLCSLAAVRSDASPHRFKKEGMNLWSVKYQRLEPADSPVVAFESSPEDEEGYHAPIMFERSDRAFEDCKGYFPPNCLFRLKGVQEGGFMAPGNIWVKQKLIIVTATFRSPFPKRAKQMNGPNKLCGSIATLSYGDRQVFVDGFNALIPSKPLLTIHQEFDRDYSWQDWCGVQYSTRDEWKYVNGASETKKDCTSGIRDGGENSNRQPLDFLERVNNYISDRRKGGWGNSLSEKDAYLSLDEVLAVRLYSGPAYLPINTFLRQVSACSGEYRLILCNHPLRSFTATCRLLSSAIRKIAAVATKEEASAPLWRGVRGELKRNFWNPDEQGLICAVDTAFMSCSRNRSTPIQYMSQHVPNVLWEVQPASESDAAYHHGADISMISQFSEELEVLFPPCTMLVVRNSNDRRKANSDDISETIPLVSESVSSEWKEADGRTFIHVQAKPAFV